VLVGHRVFARAKQCWCIPGPRGGFMAGTGRAVFFFVDDMGLRQRVLAVVQDIGFSRANGKARVFTGG